MNEVYIEVPEENIRDIVYREWDVKLVGSDEFVGVIELLNNDDFYYFTNTFGKMTEHDSLTEARDEALEQLNPITKH